MDQVHRRVVYALLLMLGLIVVGSAGFWWIEDGRADLLECVYMTVITVTTVGFGEVLPDMENDPAARIFTMALVIVGFASGGFAISTITALFVEGDLGRFRRKRKMRKTIESLSGHVVVCGAGSTGRHVVEELVTTGTPCVVIDTDENRLEGLQTLRAGVMVPFIVGDATSDLVLREAGVERARGLIAALRDDKDNLFVVISARAANPTARIVARSGDLRTFDILRKAGANAVVSPNFIGGMRLASEMVRPNVVEFLDQMLRHKELGLRVEEVRVPEGSQFAGKKLRDARIRDYSDALVLALRAQPGAEFRYNPGPDAVIEPGMTLVLLGASESVAKLRAAAGRGA